MNTVRTLCTDVLPWAALLALISAPCLASLAVACVAAVAGLVAANQGE